ncbi:MAG: HAMP domain-containing histidine kinase [Lachnospiraceae bacterium]|nr:HAMP domain-containing histidine kinase [Lachnospiraceae bacterium]
MNLAMYLKEKCGVFISTALFACVMYLFGFAFRVRWEYMNALMFLLLLLVGTNLTVEFWKKKRFYQDLLGKLEGLDQKYLITEMIKEPEFMDGKIWSEALYEIDKSMKERINGLELSRTDFKEYVELWVHEVKVPIATLSCMDYNQNNNLAGQKKQLDRIRYCVEQILFLSRADNPQKDYLMKQLSLEALVNQVVKSNKELLIGNQMRIEKDNLEQIVCTDAKWMEFIIGQMVNNSVKYVKKTGHDTKCETYAQEEIDRIPNSEGGLIHFQAEEYEDRVEFSITDYGMGICKTDLPRVFDKTFTGENGRKVNSSTGMGLYICRKLCEKMGHRIWIESEEGVYTRIYIAFGKDDYYCV